MPVPISNEIKEYMKNNGYESEMTTVEDSLFTDRFSFKYIKSRKDIVGCEIGVQFGFNAYRILTELDVKRLYLIDNYQTEDKIIEHYAHQLLDQFSNKIIYIKKCSDDAVKEVKEKLDFAYIDGDHSYDQFLNDIKNYFPLVKIDGLFAGHDYRTHCDVKKVVDKHIKNFYHKHWDWWIIKESDSLF